MDTQTIGIYIAVMVGLLILSAYFSATETAFTSVNRIRLKNLAGEGSKRAQKVLEIEERYDTLISTILVGNNIANIVNTAVATMFFVHLYGAARGATIATIVVTLVVLVFGEVSPKSLAKEHPESFAMFSYPFIKFLMVIFTPVNWIFSQWQKMLSAIFRTAGDKGITEEEIKTMVEEAETGGHIESEQSELIQNAIEFRELEAYDVLTPRVDIIAIDIEMTKKAVGELFRETGFSRLPVYEDDLDKILGVLNQKDFHNYINGARKSISDYVKPVVFVAGSMKCAELLKKMQGNKTQLAIVVDEYGGTEGLVTMEDIIEELVGEIYDEHDAVESAEITELQDGSYRVLGGTNVEKMFDFFDEEDEVDATTVNGWVVREIDKLPEVGDYFEYVARKKIFKGRVTKADERKALEINMTVEDIPEEEEKGENDR